MNLSQDEINALLSGTGSDDVESETEEQPAANASAEASVDEAPAETADEVPSDEAQDESAATDEEMFFQNNDADLDDLFARINEDPSTPEEGKFDEDGMPIPVDGMLTAEEIDILGEVGNISMGAVATAMYKLLDRRVDITTPRVRVYHSKDVLSLYKIPFVVVTVRYVEGITGNNLLVLKVPDAALITDLLMGGEGVIEEPVELNEMHLSAMSEIMNQMMGASSTSLSKLLATTVNISTPQSANVGIDSDISDMLEGSELVVKISFDMEIEGLLKSELLQLVPYDLSRELAQKFLATMLGEATDPEPSPPPAAPQPLPMQPADTAQSPTPQQPYPQQPYPQQPYPQQPYPQQPYLQQPYPQQPYPQQPYPQQPYPQQPQSLVDVHPMQFQSFDSPASAQYSNNGIGLVRDIPLQVTVELGKTKKEISEILEFNTGTVIELDKIVGDPVEIVVNGKLIARGEVVVIEENYGVRITDIVNG